MDKYCSFSKICGKAIFFCEQKEERINRDNIQIDEKDILGMQRVIYTLEFTDILSDIEFALRKQKIAKFSNLKYQISRFNIDKLF